MHADDALQVAVVEELALGLHKSGLVGAEEHALVDDEAAPFGGYKMLGNGREWVRFGLEDSPEVKAIMGLGEHV